MHGSVPTFGGPELPCHRHSQGNDTGGASVAIPAVQGLPEGLFEDDVDRSA